MSQPPHQGLPAPGRLLLGKYRVDCVLGEGGMGIVLAATHVRLNEPVAIKLLHPDLGLTGTRYARFVREARAASGIRSEHVVRVFDLGALEDGAPYIAMELLHGTDLSSLVASDGARPITDAVDHVLQACEGIAEAHARHIVHRDLKPANLFLTRRSDGSACVKVLDFGISKVGEAARSPSEDEGERAGATVAATLDGSDASTGAPARSWAAASLTRTRGRLGSPRYMSPEQTRSAKHVDARADVWALGTILYELLTGAPAFDAEDAEALTVRIATADAPSARATRAQVPDGLDAVIARCLQKSADDRFPDVSALAVALAPFGSEEGARSATKAARILRHAEGGSSTAPPPVDAMAPGVNASGATRRKAKRWVAVVASLLAGGLLVYSVRSRVLLARPSDAAVTRPTEDAGVSRMSANPDALAAYEAGMRAIRDGSLSSAFTSLDRATSLDPSFAAAHVGRAFAETVDWSNLDPKVIQAHLQPARLARDSLGERDKVLLDGIEPLARVPPDYVLAIDRLRTGSAAHDTDPLLRFALALALDAKDDPDAWKTLEGVLDLDPSFAMVWDVVAHIREVHNIPAAVADEQQCLAISPGADTCLWRLATIQSGLGECSDLRTTIERILAITPGSARAYRLLAGALAGLGEPIPAIRFALEKEWERLPDAELPAIRAEDEAALAIVEGDLATAAEKYASLERLRGDALEESAHFPATYGRMLVALESGKKGEAAAAAEAYLARRSAWSRGVTIPRVISIHALQRSAGAISEAKLRELRDRWLTEEAERRRTFGLIPAVDFAWTLAYAQTAETPEEARAAIAVRDGGVPFFEVAAWQPEYDEWIGRAYLLAGKPDDAVTFLERASRSCNVFAPRQPLYVMRATAELGEALEVKGEGRAACGPYARFLSRWEKAASPPRRAKEVASRADKLGCRR